MKYLLHGISLALLMMSAVEGFPQTGGAPERQAPYIPNLPPIDTPRPKMQGKLDVDFIGATAFNQRQLRRAVVRAVNTIEEYGLDEPNAYDTAFYVRAFYRQRGYPEVVVKERITGPWRLQLTIEEGPYVTIGGVVIEGNKDINEKTLIKHLLGPIRERYPRVRKDNDLPFIESDIWSGADLVSRLYASKGYLNAAVEPPVITMNSAQTSAHIAMRITEGIQYYFSNVRFEGETIFPEKVLLDEIIQSTGGIYSDGRLMAAQGKLEDYYKKRGYFKASVTAEGNPEVAIEGKVPVVFHIIPGALYHFDGTTVAGTNGVKPVFLENRFRKLHGKVYDPALIDNKFRELIRTGLFRHLSIIPQAIEGDQVRVDVAVEEAKPKTFGIGAGYGTFLGAGVDASYTDNNFLGTGRPFSIETELNQRGYNGEIIYRDPWLWESDYALNLRLYGLSTRLKGYSKYELGFQPTLTRYLTDHWRVSAFVRADYVSLYDVYIEPSSLVGIKDYFVASVGFNQIIDYRNNILLPTSGFILETNLNFAPSGISEVPFLRGRASFSYYLPVTKRSTLAFGARAGIISSLSQNELPIDERFFNGGDYTVRSFSELTLGPRDNAGYPLGGEAFTVFNVEYTFPIIGDLQGATFVDAGNVVQNASNFGLQNMRYAVGVGLRYNLPIGALRLDYGLNPSPATGEAQGAFHFAIGVAF
ncbi:MAG: outer membrane protein assembly factor BamA [Chthoniobacterales bacterium]